ncbi:MAG: DUF3095 domain-containing protein [Myxococcota bacterium]
MSTSSAFFFRDLPAFDDFVRVCDADVYRAAPDDWRVVITDVAGSTRAIEEGRYKDVNALGVASIVALQNAVDHLPVPFIFGGDGATLLVPSSHWEAVAAALRGLREVSETAFQLRLRVGAIEVRELARDGFALMVAKYRASAGVDLASFTGGGLGEAERRIKASHAYEVDEGPASVDFTGFECRWEPIPSQRGSVMSIIVAAEGDAAAETYRRVLGGLHEILDTNSPGRPVAADTLALQGLGGDYSIEARLRAHETGGSPYMLTNLIPRVSTAIGRLLFATGRTAFGFPGGSYRRTVAANTDFRKFDEMLRMVIDVDAAQRTAIEALLQNERESGALCFGIHCAESSLITCAIRDYDQHHVHFVDGANGGYALAARQLKAQLAER